VSELTPCNYCELQRIKRRAEQDGATVTVTREMEGDFKGWYTVRRSDKPVPVARMMALSDHCVC